MQLYANIENYYNFPIGGLAIGNYLTGVGSDTHILAAGGEGVNTGTMFYLQDGANIQITSTNVTNFDKCIHNANIGAACSILASGIVTKDIVTYDIQIEHLLTSGTIGGAFDDTKISLVSTLVGLLVQDTNDGSLLITNKLNVLFSDGTITDVSTLIIEGATMGVEKGGTLSDGGGFNVDITAGNGYFEILPDVDIIKRLDWVNTSIALSANVDVYIYFNNNGILVSNGAEPDTRYNVLLGRVVTNGTGIEFIDASPSNAEHTSNLISNNLKNAIGPVYASGSIVTENATPLNLDVTSGEYYFGENEFLPSGGTGITFTAIYGQGSGVITGQTTVDNTQYDNAGTLTALTPGYYAKGSLYLVGQGVNEKYYFVFAEAEYSTLLAVQQADIPMPPNSFTGSVVLIAGIIIQQGNANIVQIIDQRPQVGFRSSGVNASADHLSLLNLNGGVNGDGGHTNMFTVNGSKPMAGNINMATNKFFTSKRIQRLTFKRNNKIKNYIHHASKYIIKQAEILDITKIVIGNNKCWKQEINIGKKSNQNFVSIPHSNLIKTIEYKAKLAGIEVVKTEESYTSKCSAIDLEPIKKHENYIGRRTKRGLFRTANRTKINADANGAANILRKVIGNEWIHSDSILSALIAPVKKLTFTQKVA